MTEPKFMTPPHRRALFVFFLCRLGAKSCRLAGSRASLLVRVLCFCYN